jgi:hypothetical protein
MNLGRKARLSRTKTKRDALEPIALVNVNQGASDQEKVTA